MKKLYFAVLTFLNKLLPTNRFIYISLNNGLQNKWHFGFKILFFNYCIYFSLYESNYAFRPFYPLKIDSKFMFYNLGV